VPARWVLRTSLQYSSHCITWQALDGPAIAVSLASLQTQTITFQGRMGVPGCDKGHSALMEAALSSSLVHPNIVTTYSYDLKPLHVSPPFLSRSLGMSDLSPHTHVRCRGSCHHTLMAACSCATTIGCPLHA
jgi:hypothetical protein